MISLVNIILMIMMMLMKVIIISNMFNLVTE